MGNVNAVGAADKKGEPKSIRLRGITQFKIKQFAEEEDIDCTEAMERLVNIGYESIKFVRKTFTSRIQLNMKLGLREDYMRSDIEYERNNE